MAVNLPLPQLDDRRWIDLVEEGRALIPLYAPGWTDHNVHDPGITVLELLAWIAEMDIYALNQVTDAHRRKLLALAGVVPKPPQPAVTTLTIELADGRPTTELPAGLEFEGYDPFGVSVPWRARHGVLAQPGRIAAVLSDDVTTTTDLTASWRRGEPFLPFGSDPHPGACFLLGLELPHPWPAATQLSIGLIAGTGATPVPAQAEHHSARVVWELLTGPRTWTALTPDVDVDVDVQDHTRAVTQDGRVVLTTPAPTVDGVWGHRGPLAWLRVRLVRGSYDAAPVVRGLALNAVEVVQAVPGTVRLTLAPGAIVSGTPPAVGSLTGLDLALDGAGRITRLTFRSVAEPDSVRLLGFDAATASLTVEAAAVVSGTGAPSQQIDLARAPVTGPGFRVVERGSEAVREWSVRPDFEASTRQDAHLVVDLTAGTVIVGDGEHGRSVPGGSVLFVHVDHTAAAAGNLARGTVDRLADSVGNRALVGDVEDLRDGLQRIANVVPGAGGAPAETIAEAGARARDDWDRATRTVTLDDYVTLAFQTPGTRLARVEARANLHPGFPGIVAPGVVTVLVLPFLPVARPMPSAGLRAAIIRHLEPLRVLGTRVEVCGPTYVRVTVRAEVAARAEARPADVAAAVQSALARYFDPLRGGPMGTGWPFGRDIFRSEVLAVIDGVSGVAHVISLDLVEKCSGASCGNVCVGRTGLVDAAPSEITATPVPVTRASTRATAEPHRIGVTGHG
jgi:predicted phage baseplate assembly protein